MKAQKRKTNEQLIKHIINCSKFGTMSQLFIMEAIGRYANSVSESKPSDYPKNCIVNPETWIDVAKEIKEKMDKR